MGRCAKGRFLYAPLGLILDLEIVLQTEGENLFELHLGAFSLTDNIARSIFLVVGKFYVVVVDEIGSIPRPRAIC